MYTYIYNETYLESKRKKILLQFVDYHFYINRCYFRKFNMTTSQSAEQQNNKRLNLEKATNFMRQFRDPDSRELKKLSANQFMEVWSHYDKDGK